MQKRLFFLSVIIFFKLSLSAQSYTISDLINSVINNLSFEMAEDDYDSKKNVSDFDFMNFKPLEKDSLGDIYYTCFYKNNEIKRISIIDKVENRRNYDFEVLHTDSLIYMIATKSDSVKRTILNTNNIFGFFIIEKATKHIYFMGPVYFESDLETTISSTRNILILNKELIARKKLIFLNRKLIYQTSYDYSNRKVNENLWQYLFHPNVPDQGCGKYRNLGELTLSDIYKLFVNINHCPCNKLEKLVPKAEYTGSKIPFVWDVNEYFHK